MKQPVWILNSSLVGLFAISHLMLFMMQQVIPRRTSMIPDTLEVEQEAAVTPVDISKIYKQDLFGTYQPPAPTVKSVIEESVPAMPQPPQAVFTDVPVERAPTFFAPLDVILKGVIFVKDDPASCVAIVQVKKSREEKNYQVGDLIEDAQILKILSNRIILIRSNGQQETLYLREEDAVTDFNTEMKSEPKLVVEDSLENKYVVNIDEFTKRIHNLGEFINLLDLTTVYKQGKSFGCRVGKIDKDSLGQLLGFMVDDIIVKIDDFDVDDLAHRIEVYDHMMRKKAGQMVEVQVYRGTDIVTLRYALIDTAMKSMALSAHDLEQRLLEELGKQEAARYHNAYEDVKQAVKIQNLDMQDIENKEAQDTALISDDFKFDETNIANFESAKSVGSSNKMISSYNTLDNPVSNVTIQTINEADQHKKRLLLERDKLSSTVGNLRTQDKNKMMSRSKNVILNGMQ